MPDDEPIVLDGLVIINARRRKLLVSGLRVLGCAAIVHTFLRVVSLIVHDSSPETWSSGSFLILIWIVMAYGFFWLASFVRAGPIGRALTDEEKRLWSGSRDAPAKIETEQTEAPFGEKSAIEE